MKTIMLVFGTRPEAIKMCPLVKEFQKHTDEFKTVVCVEVVVVPETPRRFQNRSVCNWSAS